MKKRTPTYNEQEEHAFSQSAGDLMAGLLFIFILLLMGALLLVQEKKEEDEKIVKQYDDIKTQLYIDLQEEFKHDLKTWRATIDSTTLCVRFQEPSVLFDYDKDELKPLFKRILNDFFPRYIKILNDSLYRDHIEEIRIEGHTDSNGGYFYNMELSQDRTRAVLQYCLEHTQISLEEGAWAKKLITANGLSSSQTILGANGTEDKALSRRVEFRVRTDAEKQLEKIARNREEAK